MRILVHGSQLLYPPNTGGRIRTSSLFERLAQKHEITWVCLRRPDETEEQVKQMGACCARIETFPFVETPKFSPHFYWDLARNLISGQPFIVQKYYQPALRARIGELLRTERFDLLLCDFLQPSQNVIDLPFSPRVLFEHNVESVIFERHADENSHLLRRAYLRLQWRKLMAYEGRAARWFDHLIMVSEGDCATMKRLFGVTNTSAIATGVDTDFYRPEGEEAPEPEIVFTGSMDWLPNVDGITWFAREVLPLLVAQMPRLKVWVVGRKPLPVVQSLAEKHPQITVTGTVDDVRPYIRRARLYMVPLRIGGGTRMKIFEAMAMGKAIVSTPVGAEGLPVTHGRDILLDAEPEGFARYLLELLRDDGRRRELGEAGRRLVTEKFTWDAVAREFGDICTRVVEGHRRRGMP